MEGKVKYPLHDRVRFAIKLATSVLSVHSLGLVHKSIKPDSILITQSIVGNPKELYPYKLGNPYLLAFDSAKDSTKPSIQGPFPVPLGALWETLYTHPRHLIGYDRQYTYEMRDDIFSLGVCLLEIALWKWLFTWTPGSPGSFQMNTDIIEFDARYRAEVRAQDKKSTFATRVWFRRLLLIETAKVMVPHIIGDLFRDVVVACLAFGDESGLTESEVFDVKFEVESRFIPDEQTVTVV